MTADPVASAYAVLGLRRGCTSLEVKRAYKQLVKRWHPDRYAADPAGQAEATAQLRQINHAFRVVADAIASEHAPPERKAPAPTTDVPPPTRDPGRPLTRSQIDDIVRAMGTEGPVEVFLEWLGVAWPFPIAVFLLLAQPRGGPTTMGEISALSLICIGVVLVVRRKIVSMRRNGPSNG
jgi:DnaJ domain